MQLVNLLIEMTRIAKLRKELINSTKLTLVDVSQCVRCIR